MAARIGRDGSEQGRPLPNPPRGRRRDLGQSVGWGLGVERTGERWACARGRAFPLGGSSMPGK